jgi:3-dehydroquinate synthase
VSDHGFSVPFKFPVVFTRGVWGPRSSLFVETIRSIEPERRHRVLVVVDDQVARAHPSLISRVKKYFSDRPEALELACPPVVVPGGEGVKNDVTHCFRMLERINDVGLDRQSFVTVIGGGAVLDMVSFASAIAHRGVRTVRMPTTVLSQADSGFAVKNSVNLFGKKNFIGTFVPPFAVINDLDFLSSLNPRESIAGVSEAVKVALLRDPSFYRYIETHTDAIVRGDPDVMAAIVQRSAELHLQHICGNGDPFELGSARPLDFGHWAAHKLESMTNHRLRHGEAVAIGIALDLTYSAAMGYLDRVSAERILRLLEAIGFKLTDHALLEREADGAYTLLRGLKEFREHLGGELHITLLRGIGDSFEVTHMDESRVIAAIETLAGRGSRRTLERPSVAAAAALR